MASLRGKTQLVEKNKLGQLGPSTEAGLNQDWTMVKKWYQNQAINQAIKDCYNVKK